MWRTCIQKHIHICQVYCIYFSSKHDAWTNTHSNKTKIETVHNADAIWMYMQAMQINIAAETSHIRHTNTTYLHMSFLWPRKRPKLVQPKTDAATSCRERRWMEQSGQSTWRRTREPAWVPWFFWPPSDGCHLWWKKCSKYNNPCLI